MIETISSMPFYITIPVVLIGYSMTCLGAGILFLKLLGNSVDRMHRISAATMLATSFILGQGGVASIWLLLALGGWFTRRFVGILCFIFVLCGLYLWRSLLSGLKKQIASIWDELRGETWGWQLVAALTMILCLLWATSLGRPLSGDGSAFYMPLGKMIASSNKLGLMPGYEYFTNVGLQGEMHFAALIALYSPDAARLFSWPTIIMAGIMLVSLGRVAGMGRRGQLLTFSILFSSSAVVWLSGDGKVDLFAAALGIAACYWAVQSRFIRTKSVLLLTGLFSGFSIVAKLSYLPVMVPIIGLLVLWRYEPEFRNKDRWRLALKTWIGGCMVVLAGVILAFLPHFVKNGLLYGNPISPIGSDGVGWLTQTWFGPDVTRRILLTYPFALTYGSYWAQYGNLSPLILAFLPLVFYLPWPRPFYSNPLAVVTLAALVGIIAWSIYNPSVFSPRYILAVLLILILLPARAAEYISLNDNRPRLLAVGVITFTVISLIAFGLFFLNQTFYPYNTMQYLTGTMSECERDGERCQAIEVLNHEVKQRSRVYFASYYYYWLRGDLLQCISNTHDYDHFNGLSGKQLWLKLYQRGFKYLYIDKFSHAALLDHLNIEQLPKWVELRLLHKSDSIYVYKLTFKRPPSMTKPAVCERLSSSRIWNVDFP